MERVVINPLTKDVQSQLRKKKYNFKARSDGDNALAAAKEKKVAEERSRRVEVEVDSTLPAAASSTGIVKDEVEPSKKAAKTVESSATAVTKAALGVTQQDEIEKELEPLLAVALAVVEDVTLQQTETSTPAPTRKEEVKRDYNFTAYPQKMKLVDFSNKVYIAPLTTVGNLPWRRVMKDFGADITCGEMAMSHNLVMGQASEWARIRRHASEDCFGIQVAGGQPEHMTKIAKLLENETSSDFVDLNCGCPLDTICNR